jgi:MFS superfamily sulfate permease-like transporter
MALALDDPATITAIVLAVIVACVIVVYAMRKRGKKPEKPSEKPEVESELRGSPFRITKSVQSADASQAKDELRILDLEREILSDAIRRLYEAHAEGKITEQEREKLAATYKSRMITVKDSIAKDETIVALHELESMQEDLMKLFSERFGELSSKVEELRSKIEVKTIKEIPVQMPTPPALAPEETEKVEEEEEKQKRKRKAPEKPTPKTEAEKRIEEIRSEVEKVLDRLGQMEIET